MSKIDERTDEEMLWAFWTYAKAENPDLRMKFLKEWTKESEEE